jgi:hypothetical protein
MKSALNLLVILLLLAIALLSGLGLLPPDAAGAATAERRGQREVDVLLRVETDDERGDVDDLLADADVALADEDTSVVDRLGEAELVDEGLEAALQEILSLEGQDVIELHARLVEDTDADKAANEGIAFEETLGVLLVESKELTGEQKNVSWSFSEGFKLVKTTYRAARRILERVRSTRHTSRLLRRPYSPTSFNSESLGTES